MSNSLQLHGLQNTRLPCPSPTPGACSNSCPSSWWCHPTISSSVVPFSSRLQSFPAPGSFHMSQLFASGSQSTGVSVSTSVLPMNTQDWSPLGYIGLAQKFIQIFLQHLSEKPERILGLTQCFVGRFQVTGFPKSLRNFLSTGQRSDTAKCPVKFIPIGAMIV